MCLIFTQNLFFKIVDNKLVCTCILSKLYMLYKNDNVESTVDFILIEIWMKIRYFELTFYTDMKGKHMILTFCSTS